MLACMALLNKHVCAQKHEPVLILQGLYSTIALLLSLATIILNCIMTVDGGWELFIAQEDLLSGMYRYKCDSFMTACRQLVTMF